MYVQPKVAAQELGVTTPTLRNWARQGKIQTKTTPGGQLRYQVTSLQKPTKEKKTFARDTGGKFWTSTTPTKTSNGAIYIRVSSRKQKDDLERQKKAMLAQFPTYHIYQDIASGLNFKRKGLTRLLEHVQEGRIQTVVVAYRDRLARFGTELIEWIISRAGATLLIQDQKELSPEQELTEDLVAVTHVFSCRLNGKRRYAQTQPPRREKTQSGLQGTGLEAEAATQKTVRRRKKRRPDHDSSTQIPTQAQPSATKGSPDVDA